MSVELSQGATAAVVVVTVAIGLVLFVTWLWGLVRLFTGGHAVLGVVGIFIFPIAWVGFFVVPKPGSSRYDRREGVRREGPQYGQPVRSPTQQLPRASEPLPNRAPVLVMSHGDQAPFDLSRSSVIVGRAADANISLDDDTVSGEHALFAWDGSRLEVRDLGSTNGTMVNDTRILDRVALQDGDEVSFGAARGSVSVPMPRDRLVAPSAAPSASTAGPVLRPATTGASRSRRRSVFISYASEDQTTVQTISASLQGQGWDVWFDQRALQPGEQWGRRIADAITRSSVVLALVSPSTLQSEWVDAELQLARNSDRPILGLIIEKTDVAAIQRRLGLYLGRQWMDLSEIGERFGGPEIEEVSLTLDALAREGSIKPPVPATQRTGTAVLFLGLASLAGSVSWMVVKFLAAAGSMGEFFGALNPNADESEVFDAWGGAADSILSSFVVVPALILSIALIAVGVALRRSARRRSLRGR